MSIYWKYMSRLAVTYHLLLSGQGGDELDWPRCRGGGNAERTDGCV